MKTKTTIRNAKLDAIMTCFKQGLDNRQTFSSVKEQFPTFIVRLDYIRRVRQAVTDTKSYNMDKIVKYMAQKRKGPKKPQEHKEATAPISARVKKPQSGIQRWFHIKTARPYDGEPVVLLLMDHRMIRTIWSDKADKMALETRLFLDKAYPIAWFHDYNN